MDKFHVPSTWKRFVANGIDQSICLLFYFPFVGLLWRFFTTEEPIHISLWQLFVIFMIPAVYDFVFLVLMQGSPGKWFMDLKVVPATQPEQALSLEQCFLRPLVARLTFFFSWAIYALAFFRYDRTHLCDWVAETRVVQSTPRPRRAQLRPFVGALFVCLYISEGLSSAAAVIKQIDWKAHQVDVRAILNIQDMMSELDQDQDMEDSI